MRISKPILFSAAMIAAIIAGRKTQTRRAINPQPSDDFKWNGKHFTHAQGYTLGTKCPQGEVGGEIWVREEHYRFGHWVALPGVKTKTGKQKWAFIHDTNEVKYSDDPPTAFRISRHPVDHATSTWHKRLARFMPRSLCRINLEITDIRVEKLQDITEEDIVNEGVEPCICTDGYFCNFQTLWENINGPDSWNSNPWTWCIGFKVLR